MNKHKVNISQISLLLLLVITGGKFMNLPSILAKDVGHDSWIVVCINFFFDAVCLCFLLWAIKLNKQNLSFDKIMDKSITKVGSKIILTLFFIIFMCRVILLLDSCYNTFAVTFDVNTNWVLFMLPIVAVSAFAIMRGFNSVARTSQILFGLIFVAIVAILINPALKAKYTALLPLGEAGADKIFGSAFMRSFWFCDYIFIYFVMEDIKPQKRIFTPILTSFAVGVVLTVLLNVVFVALFGDYAQYNNLAMSKIGLFSVSDSTDGRWDWLTLSVWLMSVIIKIVVFIFCAYKCIEKIFELHFAKTNFIVLGVIALVLLVPLFMPVSTLVETFIYWFVLPFAVIQYLLQLFMPLMVKVTNKKEEVANEQS